MFILFKKGKENNINRGGKKQKLENREKTEKEQGKPDQNVLETSQNRKNAKTRMSTGRLAAWRHGPSATS
jgi:hypothetical protein